MLSRFQIIISEMSKKLNCSFSPVILRESPASSSPHKNLTGLPRVARDLSADLYNNIQKWNSLYITGAAFIKEIALLKKSSSPEFYPKGLERFIDHLATILYGLSAVLNTLETCTRQIRALTQLNKTAVPLFISWPVNRIAECGSFICDAYRQEFELKQFIFDNIPHLRNVDKLMFYAAAWVHQPYITNEVEVALESLLTETGHRVKT